MGRIECAKGVDVQHGGLEGHAEGKHDHGAEGRRDNGTTGASQPRENAVLGGPSAKQTLIISRNHDRHPTFAIKTLLSNYLIT